MKRSFNTVGRSRGLALVLLTAAALYAHDLSGQVVNPTQRSWIWRRHAGNPVLIPEQIPAPSTALYPVMGDPTLLQDDNKLKMWFGYGGFDDVTRPDSLRVRTAYAESFDGISWSVSAPALNLGSGWDRTNAETPSVIKDQALPDGHPQKYRMYYAGLDTDFERLPLERQLEVGMGYGIGLAFSTDGRTFNRIPASESPYGVVGLVLKPSPLTPGRESFDLLHVSDPHVLVKDGTYHLWYTSVVLSAGLKVFLGVAYATSSDGIRWTKHGIVVRPDLAWETQRDEPHVGRPYVFWTGARFEMFYDAVGPRDTNPADNTAAGVGFAWSVDGFQWQKEPTPVFVTNRGNGETAGIIIGSGFILKDGIYGMYYAGADPDFSHWNFNLAIQQPARVRRRP